MNTPSRRDFIKIGAAAGAYVAGSSLISSRLGAQTVNYGPKKLPFALQLYTIGRELNADPAGTFAKLRSWGFTGVEFAGYLGKDAPTLRKMLDDAGLKAVGSHVPGGASALQGDNLKTQIEFNQGIGNPRLIVASGSTGMAPGAGGGGRGRGGPAAAPLIQGMTAEQIAATGMADALTKLTQDVTAARAALDQATFSGSKMDIPGKVQALANAELALASARSETLTKLQASPSKLTPDQVQALASGGRGGRGGGGRGGAAALAITQPSATSKDVMLAAAGGFNAVSDILKPLNMFVGYHCHPGDFNLIDGVPEWDVLFSNTRPEVIMQIDIGHMGTAGGDQPTYMARYPGRAKTVHVKPSNGGGGKLVGDPGDTNNWPAIFAACENPRIGGTEWYILEYDGGSMDQVERTMARMKEWGKV